MNLYYFTMKEDTKKPLYTIADSFEEALEKVRHAYGKKELYNIAQMGEVIE